MMHRPFFAGLLIAGSLFASHAFADDADQIKASQAWIRVMPGTLPAGGYVTLANHSDHAVSLKGASSASYGHVMLHKSSTEGGMGRMEMVDSLSIPAHGTATLSPGGYHLMLMDAAKPVKVGDKVSLTLNFADGSTLVTDFDAKPANTVDAADAPMDHAHH